MRIRVKYVGTGATGVTTNAEYDVLGFVDGGSKRAVIIDDSGDIRFTSGDITNTAEWDLVSVSVVGGIQVYP